MNNDDIDKKLLAIEKRLNLIEDKLNIKVPDDSLARGPTRVDITPFAARQATHVPRSDAIQTDEKKGGNWLGMVGIICFILAAAFIIKLSIESGWLTPARQIGLAYLLGLGLIGAGLWLFKRDPYYASFLPAAGIIILYLTTFASHQYYLLISFNAALAVTVFISLICLWLYCRMQHDIYAIITALGTYLAPVVLGFHVAAIFSLYYFIVCSLLLTAFSRTGKDFGKAAIINNIRTSSQGRE